LAGTRVQYERASQKEGGRIQGTDSGVLEGRSQDDTRRKNTKSLRRGGNTKKTNRPQRGGDHGRHRHWISSQQQNKKQRQKQPKGVEVRRSNHSRESNTHVSYRGDGTRGFPDTVKKGKRGLEDDSAGKKNVPKIARERKKRKGWGCYSSHRRKKVWCRRPGKKIDDRTARAKRTCEKEKP